MTPPQTDMAHALAHLPQRAKAERKATKKYFARLAARKPRQLDDTMQALHDEVFACTDCLACANCCKTTGPLFTDRDITRLSAHLGLRPADFVARYLRMDEEGDFVLQQLPCPFLGPDNYCAVYDVRPKACREYPHTDRRNFHQILHLTLQNVSICPAAFRIVQRLREVLPA